ncbi:hypothetical protein EJ06DRAFT_504507 [Trichodelitschia bisporula]|uniref:Uncharacterized protein n=1 Tax=Trichodelitschia bisporula TaxID=703511 RepID=A0A6G1I539_9PEZI|nr:hypothetical protein EJ06DRAFT_504507 [Trichodelitschia bisporula]
MPQTYKLVTVNKVPDRARHIIGRVAEALKDKYTIIHAANCDTVDAVPGALKEHQPDLLFCASMWTPEEVSEVKAIASREKPDVAIYAIPQGLHAAKGTEGVFEHLVETVPEVLDGIEKDKA